MNKTKIKICGLRRLADIQAVNESRPDYAGFVFAPGRRQIDQGTACDLITHLHPSILPVGVFVGQSDAEIGRIVTASGIRVVQMHSRTEPGRIRQLRRHLAVCGIIGCPIWQCLSIPAEQPSLMIDLAELVRQSSQSDDPDAWLLDSQLPGQPGGTGICLDWQALRGFTSSRRLILAGGLHPGNIQQALSMIRPMAVDCSSGVESDGWKDPIKIAAFCARVREFDQQDCFRTFAQDCRQ